MCAVVKANGYGHGAVPVARAALEGGASWLAVALVEEGVELRDAGIDAPVLVLSEPPHDGMEEVVARDLTPTLYSEGGVEAAAKAVAVTGRNTPLAVHIKVDTDANGIVQLSGFAKSQAEADKAVSIAQGVKGVTSVKNDIRIQPK